MLQFRSGGMIDVYTAVSVMSMDTTVNELDGVGFTWPKSPLTTVNAEDASTLLLHFPTFCCS